MGASIGIDLGPARKPRIAIGLDPRDPERLIFRHSLSPGCLVVATAILATVLAQGATQAGTWGTAALASVAGCLLFGRYWQVFDRRHGSLQRSVGAICPFWVWRRELSGPTAVRLERTERTRTDEDGNTSVTTLSVVSLVCAGKSVHVAAAGVWEVAMEIAEVLAHFLRLPLDDRQQGLTRAFDELELSLHERVARDRGAWPGPESRRSRAGAKRKTATFQSSEDAAGTLCIHVPRPREHMFLGLTVIVLVLWTLPVSVFGQFLFGLLPPAILVACWLKVAYGFSADLQVTPTRLLVTARGLFWSRRAEFRVEELEDVVFEVPERGGPREMLWHAFPGFLIARSDRASVRFGYGLDADELEKLRRLIIGKIASESPDGAWQRAQARPAGTPQFALPRLYRPTAPLLGLTLGAAAGNFLGGRLGAGVALPFLEHILNAGGLLGLLVGLGIDRRISYPDRPLGPRQKASLLAIGLVAAAMIALPTAAAFHPLPSFFDERAMLFRAESAKDWRFLAGWVPTGIAATAAFCGLLGLLANAARLVARGFRPVGKAVTQVALLAWRQRLPIAGMVLLAAGVLAILQRDALLVFAARMGNATAVRTLLAMDSGLALRRDGRGQTALHGASWARDAECARLLLARGANVNARDHWGRTPLSMAVSRNAPDVVDLLLASGAELNATDNEGQTVLHKASGEEAIARLLVDHGADVNARARDGTTPLMLMAYYARPEQTILLLERGADVDARDAEGSTALHWAVRANRGESPAVLQLLLAHGADPELPNRAGLTPHALAVQPTSRNLAAVLADPSLPRTTSGLQQPAEAFPLAPEAMPPRPLCVPVQRIERKGFASYRFSDGVSLGQFLAVAVEGSTVWAGTEKGLVRYDVGADSALVYGASTGVPGERIGKVAAVGGKVATSVSLSTRPGYATAQGSFWFDPLRVTWRRFAVEASDFDWDGRHLWYTDPGAHSMDPLTGAVTDFTTENSGLLRNDVTAVSVTAKTVWFALRGDYVQETKGFTGGGVSRLDHMDGTWTRYTERDGIPRAGCYDLAADDEQVWVAHFDEEKGLSVLDIATGRWSKVRASANGLPVGGVAVALDGGQVWIGQQGGLVRLDRATREAVHYGEKDGLPGYIVSGIAIGTDAVWVSAYAYDGKGGIRSAGLASFPR